MTPYEFMNEITEDLSQVDIMDRYHISSTITKSQWIDLAEYFVHNIGNRIVACPRVVYDLESIVKSYRKFGNITHKQKLYIVHNLLDNWQKMPKK